VLIDDLNVDCLIHKYVDDTMMMMMKLLILTCAEKLKASLVYLGSRTNLLICSTFSSSSSAEPMKTTLWLTYIKQRK